MSYFSISDKKNNEIYRKDLTSTETPKNGQMVNSNTISGNVNNAGNYNINPLVNQATKQREYDLPSFGNKNVLSNDWYNTALKRVDATNKMKMDLKRNALLSNIINPMIRANTSNNQQNIQNNQFIQTLKNSKFQSRQNRLERENLQNQRLAQQQKQYDKTLDFNTQKFDRTHDFEMQKYLHPKQKNITPYQKEQIRMKEIDRRYKNFDPDYFNAQLPEDVDDEISDKNRAIAQKYYKENGVMPKFKSDNSWYDDDYVVDTSQQTSSSKPTQQAQSDEEKQFNEWKKRQGNY